MTTPSGASYVCLRQDEKFAGFTKFLYRLLWIPNDANPTGRAFWLFTQRVIKIKMNGEHV